jgi:hypothetical protein
MKHKVINCPIVAARPVVWLAATRPAVESLCYRAFRGWAIGADTTLDRLKWRAEDVREDDNPLKSKT